MTRFPVCNRGFQNSHRLLQMALERIPLATQTFSKSYQQFPAETSPLFLERGKGARVWDVDGNEYVDMICGLAAIVLGYGDTSINSAIINQIEKGISFSLATTLEYELAEQLSQIIPCAEMARFGKSGSDVTSAAIRVSRSYTGREMVAVCGYHGWHEWYIASTSRNKGIPKSAAQYVRKFPFGNLDALDSLLSSCPDQFAAVIMEPGGAVIPPNGYLQSVLEITHKHGALFILDEMITGFRYALGGAQELFGVTPDLATFGKGMANGMPVAALVGKKTYMRELEDVFFSGTFGGEALSLAAAIAVINFFRDNSVISRLWESGQILVAGIRDQISEHGLENHAAISGLPPWSIITFSDSQQARKEVARTIFMREMLARGVLISASLNVCFALSREDIEVVLAASANAFSILSAELKKGDVEARLSVPVVEPVFRVR